MATEPNGSAVRPRRVYLSVDFDYFSRELPEWDWSHAETGLYQRFAWITRAYAIDLARLEDHATPHPHAFFDKLRELGFTFDDCLSFAVADSHLWAAPDYLSRASTLGVDIVNFDAHHDMGYSPWRTLKRQYLDSGRVDCSNWLLGLMHQLPDLQAQLVYPSWKGDVEVTEACSKPTWERPALRERFGFGVYSEDYARSLAGRVVGVFVAKSSAWLPSWQDQAFSDFVAHGAASMGLSPELRYDMPNVDPREFDEAGARAYDAQARSMIEDWRMRKLADHGTADALGKIAGGG